HDHAPFRGRAKVSLPDCANNDTALQGPSVQSSGIDPSSGAATLHSTEELRLFAVAGFALAVTTSAQAITPAPLPQPDGMITQVRWGCGPGRTRVNGVWVARTTIRHTRRMPQGLLLSANRAKGTGPPICDFAPGGRGCCVR